MAHEIKLLIESWRNDNSSSYNSWFLWEERIKNFRSIKRGISQVIVEINNDKFGNQYRGSSLETIVHSIAEQRQIFKGADHAFLWKPKLRIPDIYENSDNQKAFARLLDTCACCQTSEQIIEAIHTIDSLKIKGLGPAVANLLYFLHPTLMSPFNTAIVKGYNSLTGAKVKLGNWQEYLAMRKGILHLNSTYRYLLSNDLGAIAGFLFDIGSGKYTAPPLASDFESKIKWEEDVAKIRQEGINFTKAQIVANENAYTHTKIQGWLRDLGLALGYDIWVASNDRSRSYEKGKLGDNCLKKLPAEIGNLKAYDSIKLIDILWIDKENNNVKAAFEVEHSTSIYSGILRMLDLALANNIDVSEGIFLVAPDNREVDVKEQISRPAFQHILNLNVRYLPYSELEKNKENIARFGSGIKGIHAISIKVN